ncbi:SDR family NAD(P)-dependent oxidoreductase [Serratia grimesii]|uniref:SDR family NAD(P)-dependent oxidoreductase n=1 Tax=Serratia grimesii TaxID=82995 RepID=UPI00223FC9DB|nr:SDR family NAD(P)-dependent oxidoreductase [Serratia grimesii]
MNQQTALVVGASKGIGLAVVKRLSAMNVNLLATWNTTRPAEGDKNTRWIQADITNEISMSDLISACRGQQFDLILINAGIYGPAHQDICRASGKETETVFTVNAVAPVQAANMLIPFLRLDNNAVLGIMTSRLASLTENPEAEMPLYAASKAALNMLTRSLLDTIRRKGATLLSIHPGWVQTDMGGYMAPVKPEQSAEGIISQMMHYRAAGGHHFVDYSGGELAW